MKPTLSAGIVLGLAGSVWMLIMGLTGWYQDPVLTNLGLVGYLILLGVLIWGLGLTKGEARTYGGQLGAGLLITFYGAVIQVLAFFLIAKVIIPDYLQNVGALQAEELSQKGMTEEQISAAIGVIKNPIVIGSIVFIGLMLVGFVFSLVLAAVIRKKD